MTAQQLTDGRAAGAVCGRSDDLLGFYGATPVAKYDFVAAPGTLIARKSSCFGYSTSAKAIAADALLRDLLAWAVQQGFGST